MSTQTAVTGELQTQSKSEEEPPQSTINLLFRALLTKFQKQKLFRHFLHLQSRSKLGSTVIGVGKLISKKMRAKLLNWMEKLALETFQFSFNTVILAIKILDEYLSLTNEASSSLQLIGCASLYLAAKVSEVVIVAGQCYVVASGNCFTEKQLFVKESDIFKVLNYNTTFSSMPTIYKYISQNAQSQNLKKQIQMETSSLFLETVKNLDFQEFKEHQGVLMTIAFIETKNRIPMTEELLQLLKQFSLC